MVNMGSPVGSDPLGAGPTARPEGAGGGAGPDLRDPRDPRAPIARIGAYLLGRRLGQGGMGSVYEATHESIGQRAAVKLLHPHLT